MLLSKFRLIILVWAELCGENDTASILNSMQTTVSYIYKITNIVNFKVYIGQAKIPKNRKYQHWNEGKKPNSKNHLYRAMNQHGLDSFQFEVIEKCSIDEVDDREKHWISYHNSCDHKKGYNKESGENLGKTRILTAEDKSRIYSKERAQKISRSLTGRKLSEEHKSATSRGVSRYYKTHEIKRTEESKRKMSAAQKIIGAKKTAKCAVDPAHPDAQPKKCHYCDALFFPKKMSPWKIKCHVIRKFCSKRCIMLNNNKNVSLETREKIANSKRGQKMSEEQKRKTSESMKRYREEQRESRKGKNNDV